MGLKLNVPLRHWLQVLCQSRSGQCLQHREQPVMRNTHGERQA
jgi:hypothetical protein